MLLSFTVFEVRLHYKNEKEVYMKKIAVLVADLYDDLELHYPLIRLKEEGHTVHLVGDIKGHGYKSKHGMIATAEFQASELDPKDYDAVIIPGGFSPDYMRRSESILKFVRGMGDLKKIIAAICHGPWLMASTCDLKGRQLTCFYSIKDDIIHAGAIYVDLDVVIDQNYITSRTPKDLPAFLKGIISSLK
jgi:protease I